jgi:uncharacterized membrane protein YphA (DoxX/SURF4 family)
MNLDFYNQPAAYGLARVILGILFLIQGYDKIFNIKMRGVVQAYELPAKYPFSNSLVWIGTVFTSFAEFIGGLLLIFGLFTSFSLHLLGIDMVLVVLAMSALNPVWDMKFVFPRLALLFLLLIMPATWNLYSIDHFIF